MPLAFPMEQDSDEPEQLYTEMWDEKWDKLMHRSSPKLAQVIWVMVMG